MKMSHLCGYCAIANPINQRATHNAIFMLPSVPFLASMANSVVAYYLFATINISPVLQNQHQQKNPK